MIKRLLDVLPKNLKVFVCFGGIYSIVIFVAMFFTSFSITSALLAFVLNIFSCCFFFFLEVLRKRLVTKRIRVLPILFSVAVVFLATILFSKMYDNDKGLSYVYSHQIEIETADQLLKYDGDYKNALITVNAESFSKTEYGVETVISGKGETEGETSGIWDDDDGIRDIITDRKVLYEYYVFPFDGEYFVAKISYDAVEHIKSQNGNFSLECLISAPNDSEQSICNVLCNDLRRVIYPVDVFDGESVEDYYEDLDTIKGNPSVLITVEYRNLFFERVYIATSFSVFVLGSASLLFIILYAPPMNPLPKKKKEKKA